MRVLEASSGRIGSVASDLAWSTGLVVAALVLAGVTVAFVWDYRRVLSRYFQSTVESGREFPLLGPRYERLKVEHFKVIIALIGWVFAGLLFILGIYGFLVS